MHLRLEYGQRNFGTLLDTLDYDLSIDRENAAQVPPRTVVEFRFNRYVAGRGANSENAGSVRRLVLKLSTKEARLLAATLLWHIEGPKNEPIEVQMCGRSDS